MDKREIEILEEVGELVECAQEKAEKLADLEWKIEHPLLGSAPYWENCKFESNGFNFSGYDSGEYYSTFIPLSWLADDSDWEESANTRIAQAKEAEAKRNQLRAVAAEANAKLRRQAEFMELQKEFG